MGNGIIYLHEWLIFYGKCWYIWYEYLVYDNLAWTAWISGNLGRFRMFKISKGLWKSDKFNACDFQHDFERFSNLDVSQRTTSCIFFQMWFPPRVVEVTPTTRGWVHHGRSYAHGVVGSGYRCQNVCVSRQSSIRHKGKRQNKWLNM